MIVFVSQEVTVKTGHGTMDWFKIDEGVQQGYVLSPCLFNLYAEYIMWNAEVDESQTGSEVTGRNINNLRYAGDTTLMAESKEELKSLLMMVKDKSRKSGLNSTFRKLRSQHSVPSLHSKWMGGKQKHRQILFSWAPKSLQMVTAAMNNRCFSLEETLWQT